MKIAVYLRNARLTGDSRIERLKERLVAGGCSIYDVRCREDISGDDTDMLVCIGGDGTFLSAAVLVGDSGIPVLGMNLGRLGFLSENGPDQVALMQCSEADIPSRSGPFSMPCRLMLQAVRLSTAGRMP